MFEKILELLKRAWNSLKGVFVKVVSFVGNIIGFFKSKYAAIIKKKPNAIGISLIIKKKLESGDYKTVNLNDYKIVNTFYDKDTNEILEEETEVILYKSLDEQTKKEFEDTNLIMIEN